VKLDLIGTVAFGGAVLLAGYGMRRVVPVLARYNLPAPVIGGLGVAIAALIARSCALPFPEFDTTLQSPLMIAFFTSIGFGASVSMLRKGGPLVLRFLALAAVLATVQSLVGILIAVPFGLDPLFGVLAGTATLSGGPATGLAFAPLFEQAGVHGAASIAVAMGMAGILCGGVAGGPVSTLIIERQRLRAGTLSHQPMPAQPAMREASPPAASAGDDEQRTLFLVRNVIALLIAMAVGSWVSAGIGALGITLPAYVGAMLVAAALRNLDDATGKLGLSPRFLDDFGAVALSLFLVLALMTLRLWELAGLAVPLVTILAAQVLVVSLAAPPVFRLMGRDYDAAVMSGGFVGFMLGTTANAMAVMRALVERYGPAPTAFLVAPMVGAFFIDFTNALIITAFLNLLA
jgi:glutamate:Na+ symporter, ESS family